MTKSEEYEAKLMESVAVIKVAVGVEKAQPVSLHQDHNEPFRTFATSVQSKAETYSFTTVVSVNVERKCYKLYRRSK